MMMWQKLKNGLSEGDFRSIARAISLVENEVSGCDEFLESLPPNENCHIIGMTGPPGAGKSTLTDALIEAFLSENEKVAVLCIDPSSPFNFGAILGDRIRMSKWYNHPHVFIRSLASRGSLGGTCPMIIEIAEIIKSAGFNKLIIETVGVGQSEVEIAGIADTTIVVLVPESGDDIQSMKAGLMEIADLFVLNKADRPGVEMFALHLQQALAIAGKEKSIPIFTTIASTKTGIDKIVEFINSHTNTAKDNDMKELLLVEKIYKLIQKDKMKNINRDHLRLFIRNHAMGNNIIAITKKFLNNNELF